MSRISYADYVYASSYVKTKKGNGTDSERLTKLLEAKTLDDVYSCVAESGFAERTPESQAGADRFTAISEYLDDALDLACRTVRECVPDPDMYDFLFYKFDCNNIKTAIKSSYRGIDDDSLYFRPGKFDFRDIAECVAKKDFAILPENMREAAALAMDEYERSGEGRKIDLILDKACFADMSANARASGVDFFREYVEALADTTNVRTAYRLLRMSDSDKRYDGMLADAFVPGGTVTEDQLRGIETADDLAAVARKLPLSSLYSAVTASKDQTELAANLNHYVDDVVNRYATVTFGPEVPAVFFLQRENDIKRYRVMASFISAGEKSRNVIRERVGAI